MLNHTSLQLSDVLPKKHLNLQRQLIWPIDHAVIWSTIQFTNWPCSGQNKKGDIGMLVILTLSRSTLRGGGGGSTSFTGRRHRKLWKKYLDVISNFCPSLLSTAKLKCRKSCRIWWGGFWYFSCFGLEVRQSSDACVDRCVFIQEQICLRTATNMFHINWQIYLAWSHKYISFLWQIYFKIKPANLFVWSDKYFHKM